MADTLFAPFYAVMAYSICGALGVSGHGLLYLFHRSIGILCLTRDNFVQEQNHNSVIKQDISTVTLHDQEAMQAGRNRRIKIGGDDRRLKARKKKYIKGYLRVLPQKSLKEKVKGDCSVKASTNGST